MSKSLKVEKSNIVKSNEISVYEGKYILDNVSNCNAELIKDLSKASEIIITGYNIMARFKEKMFIVNVEILKTRDEPAKIQQILSEIPVKINNCFEFERWRQEAHCNTDIANFSYRVHSKTGYYGTKIGNNDKYIVTAFKYINEADDTDNHCVIVYNQFYDVIGIRLMDLEYCGEITSLGVYFLKDIIVLKDDHDSYTITMEDDSNECPVCFEQSDVFCVPCGHKLCHKCYVKVVNDGCPKCRHTITGHIAARFLDNKTITKYIYDYNRKLKKQPKPDLSPDPSPDTIKKK